MDNPWTDLALLTYLATTLVSMWGSLLFTHEWYKYGAKIVFKCFTILNYALMISSAFAVAVRYARLADPDCRLIIIETCAADQMLLSWWWAGRNIMFFAVYTTIIGILTFRTFKRFYQEKLGVWYDDE